MDVTVGRSTTIVVCVAIAVNPRPKAAAESARALAIAVREPERRFFDSAGLTGGLLPSVVRDRTIFPPIELNSV
jgi:hypothetical protein